MKHNFMFKHTGKCFVCGEDTNLPIHKECGDKINKKKRRKKKEYSKSYINHLAGIDK